MKLHNSMRGQFAYELYLKMETDLRIYLITADLGYKVFDEHFKHYPDRVLNVGAAEHCALNMCIGLALQGRIPFFYSITPFLVYRPFESLRNYISKESIPVKMIGSGRDKDYYIDGFSHDSSDVRDIIRLFPNIYQRWPETQEQIPSIVSEIIDTPAPYFLSLRR